MDNLVGTKICGKPSFNNFISTVRVDPFTLQCPEGFKLCAGVEEMESEAFSEYHTCIPE